MYYKRTTDPAEEPVSLAEAKAHLRVTFSDDDDYISTLIQVAREWCETFTRRAFIAQSWTLKMDAFPGGDIVLPIGPVSSVTSITYLDTAGSAQTLSSSLYTLYSHGPTGQIRMDNNAAWPSTDDAPEAVTVIWVAGYE